MMKIVGFAQEMRLGARGVTNVIKVELPDGSIEGITTSEETIKGLLKLFERLSVPRAHTADTPDLADADVFGGDSLDTAEAEEAPLESRPSAESRSSLPRPAFISEDDLDGEQI